MPEGQEKLAWAIGRPWAGNARPYNAVGETMYKTRKNIRLTEFDYGTPGAYFITVCTNNHEKIFWENVGASIARPEEVRLSELGKIVEQAINKISVYYPGVCVDIYTIMPNHVHLLLQIKTDEDGRAMPAPTISTVVQQMKGSVTKQAGKTVWQKGFYDHVVRGGKDYREVWSYIEGNPIKWEEDHG